MKPLTNINRRSINLINIACLLGMFIPALAFSQTPEIKFKQISVEQGLSNSWVEAIGQDYMGFMWFGTRNGLDMYDGQKITVYKNDAKDTNSISDNFIRCIYSDRQHNLWIGTANGLNLFNAAKNTFTRYKHNPSDSKSISNNSISCIYEDSRNNLWVSTLGGGLNLFNRKQNTFRSFQHSAANGAISDDNVNYIYEDVKGNVWIATDTGLNLFNSKTQTFTTYRNKLDRDNSNSCNVIKYICGDKNGNLFLGTPAAGVIVFNFPSNTFTQLNHRQDNDSSLSGNFVYSMLTGYDGRIWVGTVNEGLNLYNSSNNSFAHYRHEPSNNGSLAQRTASAIFEDKQHNLWVGTHRGGVCLYAPGADKFKTYRQEADVNSLSYSDVKAFCQDRKGNIWIGTDGGGLNLFNRDKNTFTHYVANPGNANSLNSDAILDIIENPANGGLWISTWGGGLNFFDPEKGIFSHYKNNPEDKTSISSNFVQKAFEDSEGNLWIGTYYGGLNLFNKQTNTFTRITKDAAGATFFSGNNVVAINEDKQKNVWIGTDDGGLNCYSLKTKQFTHYFNTGEKSPDCRVIFIDHKGRVWIGQLGLYLYNPALNKFSLFPGDGGFATEFIKGITEDEEGNLFVSTSNGLARFNPDTHSFKKFNTADGLQGSEYESNAFLRASNGEMFFGGNTGLNTFFPKDIKTNRFVPPVYITGFQIFNKPVIPGAKGSPLSSNITFTKEITLDYRQSSISFDFAALNYVTAENNQYAYQLDGIDKDWVYAGSATKASYTNLSHGTYTFHVKAANNDGIWNETGASVIITIKPPFWLTWWFKALCVIVIAGSIYAYYYSRVKHIRLQKIELEKQVKERTAEVMHKAEELLELNEELKAQSEALTEQAAHLKALNEQLEAQKEQELEKAVAQNKFEIASEVLHDVGNALVGFGAHVNRVNRSVDQNNLDNLQNLATFLKMQQPVIGGAIGADKAGALTVLAECIAKNQKENKEDIRKSVTELFNIISHIEQILNIQRQYVRNQAQSSGRKPVDLINVINDCRAMVSASIDKRNITLKVNVEPGKYVLKGDYTKLMQVILNVLKNSIEAISPEAEDKRINICLKNTDNKLEMILTDSGHGFDEATGLRLFERGFTTKESGTGLGLYNCRSIIETHGGSFQLKSPGPGLGSTTVITFAI